MTDQTLDHYAIGWRTNAKTRLDTYDNIIELARRLAVARNEHFTIYRHFEDNKRLGQYDTERLGVKVNDNVWVTDANTGRVYNNEWYTKADAKSLAERREGIVGISKIPA